MYAVKLQQKLNESSSSQAYGFLMQFSLLSHIKTFVKSTIHYKIIYICTAAMEIKCVNHLLFNTTFVHEVIMHLYSWNLLQQNLLILSVLK